VSHSIASVRVEFRQFELLPRETLQNVIAKVE